jgi:hypothetical protein
MSYLMVPQCWIYVRESLCNGVKKCCFILTYVISWSNKSVPTRKPIPTWNQDHAMDHNTFSPSFTTNSVRDAYVPADYISAKTHALLAATEAAAACLAANLDAGVLEHTLNGSGRPLKTPFVTFYCHEQVLQTMAPPKVFLRTFWQSITLKLLVQRAQSAWQT